jgi:hypothetical protein
MPPRKKTKPSKKRQTTLNWGGIALAPPSSPVVRHNSKLPKPHHESDDELPTPRPQQALVVVVETPKRTSRQTIDSSDDDEPVQGSGRRRKSLQTNEEPAKRRKIVDSDEDEDPIPSSTRRRRRPPANIDILSEEDDGDPIPSSARRRKSLPIVANIDLSEDEDPIPSSARRRKSHPVVDISEDDEITLPANKKHSSDTESNVSRQRKSASSKSVSDGEDEDLADILSSAPSSPGPRSNKKKAQFQDRLALLRARRERVKNGEPSATPDGSDEEEGSNDDDDDDHGLSGDLDAELEGFIESDGDDTLIGAPDIPLHLTAAVRAPSSENFRIYAEYLVFDTLFPSRYNSEGRVALAMRQLDTMVSTFGESVAGSGAWRVEYTRALKARPTLVKTALGSGNAVPHCDACNRNSQNCTVKVRFVGSRYDWETLEDVEGDGTDEEELFGEGKEFYLGWTCRVRTENAHAIAHWRKRLKMKVVEELQEEGVIDEEGKVLDEEVMEMTDQGM